MKSFLFMVFLGIACLTSAQQPPACAGGSTSTNCANACINCNFNGYVGSTAGFPSGIVPNFCGTVENAQWMGFIAGASNASFTITPSDCAFGDGVQVALYEDCMGPPIACNQGEMGGGNLPIVLDVQVTPGRNYFLMIDGFAGDFCDFSVSVSPANAVYEPPLGAVGSITGPAKVCPGATMTYQVSTVYGANAYIWSGPPGAKIDTIDLPVTLVGPGSNQATITFGNVGGQICVQAANACSQTPACTNPFIVEILDDAYKPALSADTLAHLTCSGSPLTLKVAVQSVAGFEFQWTSDSSGHIVAGENFKNATVDKTGTYTLEVRNAQNGCASSIAIQVGEPDTPNTAALMLKNITCFGFDNGELRVGPIEGGLAPYTFSMDNTTWQSSPEFRYLTPGFHPLSIQTADECRWDTIIEVLEPGELLLDLGDDTEIHLGATVQLWAETMVNDPLRVQEWRITPPELQHLICTPCPYMPTHSFRYTLSVQDANGCLATDDRIISVSKERYVYAPTVFSPNAPEGNDRFVIFGGEDVVEISWLRVFDRWGQLVFEGKGLYANDLSAGWDGKVNGEISNPAVFIWQANILYKDGESETRQGDVTLIR